MRLEGVPMELLIVDDDLFLRLDMPGSAAGAADLVRLAGPDAMPNPPVEWDDVDETSDESFPASTRPARG